MIDYFKYTTGNLFTLSGAEYDGLFNITDGKAFTGKSYSTSSKLLSASQTFLTNCFLNSFEFDRTTSPVDSNLIEPPIISPRNIIDQNFIDRNLQILNINNLKIFAQNITANPDLFDFINSVENTDSYFLGLSSSSKDIRNDDTKVSKTNSFPIQIDPFSYIDKVQGLDVLDDTKDSIIFVYDDESYYYFTTTSTNSYTFSGSFVNGGSLLRIEEDVFQGAERFSYDNNTDTLYAVTNNENNFTLNLYDNSFVAPCRVLKLVDQITIDDEIVDGRVSVGKDIVGYRHVEDNIIKIKLLVKYTFEDITNILSSNPAEEIIDFDIRDSDDSILVLTSLNGFDAEEYYLYHLDIDVVSKGSGDYILPFTPKVLKRYKPDVNYDKKPGEVDIYFSGNDSNILTIYDEGAVSTRFITNPENVAGFPYSKNLLYLQDMYFDGTLEKFNTIEKKFNSNLLPSNNYNNLNFLVAKNSSDLFYVLHNIGRIYLIKESKLPYKSFIPNDLKTLFEKIISCESSIGISLNSELRNIIKDSVNVFLNASVIPYEEMREGIPVLGKYVSYEGIDINFRNLEFHENEEINFNNVSRVFNEIYNLQKTIFNIITTGEDIEVSDLPPVLIEEDTLTEVLNNQYTSGGEYIVRETGEEYIGFYHIHPEKGAMVGPLHVATPHDYLDPFIEQDNETSSIINQTTIQSTSRSSTSSGTSSGTSGSSY